MSSNLILNIPHASDYTLKTGDDISFLHSCHKGSDALGVAMAAACIAGTANDVAFQLDVNLL